MISWLPKRFAVAALQSGLMETALESTATQLKGSLRTTPSEFFRLIFRGVSILHCSFDMSVVALPEVGDVVDGPAPSEFVAEPPPPHAAKRLVIDKAVNSN